MTDCLFCKIAAGEIPAKFVYEDETVVAFADIAPRLPVHILIVPKKHIVSLGEATSEDVQLLGHIQLVACQIAEKMGIRETGFRLVTNSGADSGQEVPHLHYHLIGGEKMKIFC